MGGILLCYPAIVVCSRTDSVVKGVKLGGRKKQQKTDETKKGKGTGTPQIDRRDKPALKLDPILGTLHGLRNATKWLAGRQGQGGDSSEPHPDLSPQFRIPRNELSGFSHGEADWPVSNNRRAGKAGKRGCVGGLYNTLWLLSSFVHDATPRDASLACYSSAALTILGNENIGWYFHRSPIGLLFYLASRYFALVETA